MRERAEPVDLPGPPQWYVNFAPAMDSLFAARAKGGVDAEGRTRAEGRVELVLQAADSAQVLFIGEHHGDPGAHAFQRELLARAIERHQNGDGPPIVLSLEMFERDVQHALDRYLTGELSEEEFRLAAPPWPGYDRDHRPLVELAKRHQIQVVAATAPREATIEVSRGGWDALGHLPDALLEHLPPPPLPAPSLRYRTEWADALVEFSPGAVGYTQTGNAIHAMGLWDATMGFSIHEALEARPDALVIHLAGAFHVKNRTGIPEALRHYRQDVREVVVLVRPVRHPDREVPAELDGVADFVVLTERERFPAVGPFRE